MPTGTAADSIPGGPPARGAVIPREMVLEQGRSRLVGPGAQQAEPVPTVSVIRRGDIVDALQVTCTCGRITRVQCIYGPIEAPPESNP
jgi:hypothetical protein